MNIYYCRLCNTKEKFDFLTNVFKAIPESFMTDAQGSQMIQLKCSTNELRCGRFWRNNAENGLKRPTSSILENIPWKINKIGKNMSPQTLYLPLYWHSFIEHFCCALRTCLFSRPTMTSCLVPSSDALLYWSFPSTQYRCDRSIPHEHKHRSAKILDDSNHLCRVQWKQLDIEDGVWVKKIRCHEAKEEGSSPPAHVTLTSSDDNTAHRPTTFRCTLTRNECERYIAIGIDFCS